MASNEQGGHARFFRTPLTVEDSPFGPNVAREDNHRSTGRHADASAFLNWTGLPLQDGTLCSANFLRSGVNFSLVAVSANVQAVRRSLAPLFLLRGHRHECGRGSFA